MGIKKFRDHKPSKKSRNVGKINIDVHSANLKKRSKKRISSKDILNPKFANK